MNRPPFTITPELLRLVARISELTGRFNGLAQPRPQPKLRKENRVRTVQGTAAIEGNTLSLDQVTAILEGKRVAAPKRELQEIENAIRAYELAPELAFASERDFLRAHSVLMAGLAKDAGKWRSGNVGVMQGSRVAHIAPKAALVPKLMRDLFAWLKTDKETPEILKAAIAHYEIEFIHPFSDGNGRMGRLWQHVVLLAYSPVFAFVPFESAIRVRQEEYYGALRSSDRAGDCTNFLVFSLQALADSLDEFLGVIKPEPLKGEDRLDRALQAFGTRWFTRKDYLGLFKDVSTATASRDLARGIERRVIIREGEKARARYRGA